MSWPRVGEVTAAPDKVEAFGPAQELLAGLMMARLSPGLTKVMFGGWTFRGNFRSDVGSSLFEVVTVVAERLRRVTWDSVRSPRRVYTRFLNESILSLEKERG